jgi:alpha-galactosidase
MLNVSNPLTPLTRVVNRETSVRAVGLCHGVDHHARHLAALAGAERPEEMDYVTAGIDHCPWLLELKVKGRDAGEVLLEMGVDEWLATPVDRVPKESPFAGEGGNRAALRLWREIGYMPGISDRHITEFFPHFLKDRETIARYGIRLTTIRDREQGREAAMRRVEEMASGEAPLAFPPTSDNVVGIVEALEGGARLKDSVNAPNVGQVSNLPEGAVVETLCVYDTAGRHPITAGPLPPVLRAIVEPHLVRQELVIDAALEGDRKKALQALIDDPRVLDVDIARPMLEALLEGNREYLPRFF